MDDDQNPLPAAPWVSRSVWALAPALFFYEMLLGFVWLFTLGFLFDPLLVMISMLPALAYFLYRFGIKCSTEETAPRVPRLRILGASFLVALIHGFFLYLITKDELATQIAKSPENLQRLMEPIIASGSFTPEEIAQLTPAFFVSFSALLVAVVVALGLFLLHLIALWVGVRSVEKVRS